MEDLIRKVKHHIRKDGLKSKCRKPYYTHRRMYLFNLLRNAGVTYSRIAELFDLNHATIIHGIKRYENLKQTRDAFLLLDIADYDGKFQLHKHEYNLKRDILKATTIRDLEIIKGRTEKQLYKELI